MNNTELQQNISMSMELAFMAGRWVGQVDLEEFMDNDFSDAIIQALYIKKNMDTNHVVESIDTAGKYVRYKLRSDQWREGVKKDAREYLKKATEILFKSLS